MLGIDVRLLAPSKTLLPILVMFPQVSGRLSRRFRSEKKPFLRLVALPQSSTAVMPFVKYWYDGVSPLPIDSTVLPSLVTLGKQILVLPERTLA